MRCSKNNCEYVKNINPPVDSGKKLSARQRSTLENPVIDEEIDKCVRRKLKKEGKAPGPDGIPYIYIYKFWPQLRYLISKIITIVMNNKIMPKNLPDGLVIFTANRFEANFTSK